MKQVLLFIILLIVFASCSKTRKVQKTAVAPKGTEASAENARSRKIVMEYARILEVDPDEIKNEQLYLFVDQWRGVPYRYGGLDTKGVDCSGFAGNLYREVYGKQLPRTTAGQAALINPVQVNSLQEGDLVFFNVQGKKDSHVGVYLRNQRFVHASTSQGVVISDLRNPYYKKHFSMAGRVR